MKDSVGALDDASWFTTLDVISEYWVVQVTDKNRDNLVHLSVWHILIGFYACRSASLTHVPLFNVRWTCHGVNSIGGRASLIWTT